MLSTQTRRFMLLIRVEVQLGMDLEILLSFIIMIVVMIRGSVDVDTCHYVRVVNAF